MGVLLKSIKAEEQLAQAASALKVSSDNVASRAASVMTELKDVKKSLEDIKKAEMMSGLDDMVKEATDIEGVKLITKKFENAAVDDLRNLCDDIKKLGISSVMVFATVNEGKVVLLVSVTDDLLAKGFHSGGIVKELAKSVGGGGGGKADMAQAGGKNPAGIPWAFDLAERMLIDKLENKEEE